MKATEKNPNILQCCQRKNILAILEKMASTLEHCRKSLLAYLERCRQKYPRFYFLSLDDVLHIICNGYDLSCVNQYISKLYENVGALVYEDTEDSEKKWMTQITSVRSYEGETLLLRNPVPCEGAIDSWLGTFVHQLQTSLQHQVVTAMGVEQPCRKATLNSAGARKIARKHSKSEKSASNSGEHVTTDDQGSGEHVTTDDQGGDGRATTDDQGGDGHATTDDQGSDGHADDHQFSWIFDHVAEVVYLVSQMQFRKQTEDMFMELKNGNTDAWQKATDKMAATMKAVIAMLKGTQEDRVNSTRYKKCNVNDLSYMKDWQKEEGPYDEEIRPGTTEPVATEPVDTMNLMDIPIVPKKDEEGEQDKKEKEDDAESDGLKMQLFPSQIHKISSLIGLHAHQRDLLQRLQTSQGDTRQSFEWASQLQYHFSPEPCCVSIEVRTLSQLQYHFSPEPCSVSIEVRTLSQLQYHFSPEPCCVSIEVRILSQLQYHFSPEPCSLSTLPPPSSSR
ncbi:hypothetical protein LSAT2_008589 [Lamellibrachia satsuma]|nr:hypothetical protein LSAT2_008589 [Lamellibrachia satsuma]